MYMQFVIHYNDHSCSIYLLFTLIHYIVGGAAAAVSFCRLSSCSVVVDEWKDAAYCKTQEKHA